MKNLILLILAFQTFVTYSQSGIIYYTAQMNLQHKKDFIKDVKNDEDVSMSVKQQVINLYQNTEPDYYELHFNNNKSYYFKDKALKKENSYSMGSKAGNSPFYTNTKSGNIAEDSRIFNFVSYEPLSWKITNTRKKIGKIECLKATATETLYSRQGHYYDREIIAWFAPEIKSQ